MIIDMSKYDNNRIPVQKWFVNHPDIDVGLGISILSNTTMCPCIVVAYWAGDILGYTPHILKTIETLTKFYKYTKITNCPRSFYLTFKK